MFINCLLYYNNYVSYKFAARIVKKQTLKKQNCFKVRINKICSYIPGHDVVELSKLPGASQNSSYLLCRIRTYSASVLLKR